MNHKDEYYESLKQSAVDKAYRMCETAGCHDIPYELFKAEADVDLWVGKSRDISYTVESARATIFIFQSNVMYKTLKQHLQNLLDNLEVTHIEKTDYNHIIFAFPIKSLLSTDAGVEAVQSQYIEDGEQ